ncbi:MAG: ABC transporter ATP-binding protein [Gaiellaceae bacterium MAG52_C11]|nr:ABC transporter ATP-binding protein [Candidatus Gaiellasilicea maunaloa]
MISARGLTRRFRDGHRERLALAGVDLDVAAGEYVVVFGRSGAGKTTLLNLLGGLDRPSSGSVSLIGVELASLGRDRLAALRRDRIGFVFQTFGLLSELTAVENVEVPLRLQRTPAVERDVRVHEALELVGLGLRGRHFPDQLSGGEQQRVAIARALVSEAPLLLADEPTSQLDSASSHAVAAILRELVDTRGLTAVVTTHDPIVVAAADRTVELDDGRIVAG